MVPITEAMYYWNQVIMWSSTDNYVKTAVHHTLLPFCYRSLVAVKSSRQANKIEQRHCVIVLADQCTLYSVNGN